jgi:hypothetical protein
MVRQSIIHFLIEVSKKEQKMKVKYFEDTDTLFIKLSERSPVETRELNENVINLRPTVRVRGSFGQWLSRAVWSIGMK